MNTQSDTTWPASFTLLMLSVVCLALLSGCATEPDAAPVTAVERGAPDRSESPESSAGHEEPATTAAPVTPGFTLAEGEQISLALENHRAALLSSDEHSLPAEEAGYYLDTLEARMIQLLRDTPVRFERRNNRFELLFASGNSFATGTARLTDEAVEQLLAIVDLLVEYDRTQVLIFGHTDNVGDAASNQDLSSRRAIAVARVLVDAGVQPRRILVAGFGEYRPIADNDTESGRALNRRVELIVDPLVR